MSAIRRNLQDVMVPARLARRPGELAHFSLLAPSKLRLSNVRAGGIDRLDFYDSLRVKVSDAELMQ